MKCYIAIKSHRPLISNTCPITLYCIDPVASICCLGGKRKMTIGQLLCHIGCSELEKWQFVGQVSIFDFSITGYRYPAEDSSCDREDVKLILIDDLPVIHEHTEKEEVKV